MTSSTKPLSKWERQYSVLKHPVLGIKVIRLDFGSIWMLLIGPLYLFFRKLWLKAFLFTGLSLFLGFLGTVLESPWPTVGIMGLNLFLLFKTGKWIEADLLANHGYTHVGTCNAKSAEQALAIVYPQPSDEPQLTVQVKSRSVWKTLGLGLLVGFGGVVAFISLIMIIPTPPAGSNQNASNLGEPSNGLPACDSFRVKVLRKSAIIGIIPLMVRANVIGIKEISTLAVKDDQNKCRAIVATGAGRVKIDYAVHWINKERDGWSIDWISSPVMVHD